jgi:hypothetical protein
MFYLIGVAHRAQQYEEWQTLDENQLRLVKAIRDSIERLSPSVIAEEHSLEALGQFYSIAKRLADEFRLEHRFCDPRSDERNRMGYKDRGQLEIEIFTHSWDVPPHDIICGRAGAIEIVIYFPMRERYWLQCLSDVLAQDVLFICGQAHIESFSQLLKSEEIDVTIVAERIGVNAEDDRLMTLARNYLAAHPDPAQDELGEGMRSTDGVQVYLGRYACRCKCGPESTRKYYLGQGERSTRL